MPDYEIGWLFADLNAFFASIEQELRPELRGQPIGIVPIDAATACCIAASYQAKAYGVKTGIRLDEALILCPHLIVVQARLHVGFYDSVAYEGSVRIPLSRDPFTLQDHVIVLWERVPSRTPSDIAAMLTHLIRLQSLICSRLSLTVETEPK